MNPTQKLHAYLAHMGVASRRQSEQLIADGKVMVNGQLAKVGQRVTPGQDNVTVDGKPLQTAAATVLYLINKPPGVISTTQDELGRPTVIDFLKKAMGASAPSKFPRLYPVGRLDRDSEGLMLLTNDGDLAQKMTHPSYETAKTYRVTVAGQPTDKALDHLRRGVKLVEGYTSPAEVEVVSTTPDETVLDITIHEGRYHQVKRMCLRVGYEVQRLQRTQLGPYTLADLEGKKWRQVLD